jgi:succinoglycan biosynthesis transport protein ExoP
MAKKQQERQGDTFVDPVIDDHEEEFDILEYYYLFKRRKYTILTVVLIVFIATVFYTLSIEPVYTASTKLLVERNDPNPLSQYSYRDYYDPEFQKTQTEIITSIPVSRRVVDLLNLEKEYTKYSTGEKKNLPMLTNLLTWGKDVYASVIKSMAIENFSEKDEKMDVKQLKPMSKRDMLASRISGGISVEAVEDSRILLISFTSHNPELAGLIVNSVADAYIAEMLEMQLDNSGRTIKWMSEKAEKERERIQAAEGSLQEYMRNNNILTVENRIAIIPERLAEVARKLTESETKRKELEVLKAKVNAVAGKPDEALALSIISDNEIISLIRKHINEADQRVIELSKKYGEKHPAMKRAKSDLRVLVEKRNAEIKRVIKSINNQYEIVHANEMNIRNTLDNIKQEAAKLNEKFVKYEILKREIDANELLYESLVTKIKEHGITDQAQKLNIWVVEKAEIPIFPSNRSIRRNLILALAAGLMLGYGFAFLLDYMDKTIKSPSECEKKLKVPTLGGVSFLRDKRKKMDIITFKEPSSVISESYRTLRTSIELSSTEGPPEKILITSSSPLEGKSVTSTNLSITFAQMGSKVLLIDADMRKPRIHKIFGVENKVGLSTCLSTTSKEIPIQEGPLANFFILTAGPRPPNPSELLHGCKLPDLIDQLKDTYGFDHIFFDSPPVISVSDALIITQIVDATIMVVRSGETTYSTVEMGLKNLRKSPTNIIGLVVNAIDLKKVKYYYYSRDYHYYGKYYGEQNECKESGVS